MSALENKMTNSSPVDMTGEMPSLLFVDDEPSILKTLRVVFRTGFQVTVTTDGFEAIELLKSKKFDVIVSDQRMPKITGVDVLRHARDLAPNTVRILLTGYSDTDAILGAINDVEVHRFLQKPWDNTKIRQTINEAVQLARSLSGHTTENEPDLSSSAAGTTSKRLADVVPLPVQHRPRTTDEKALPSSGVQGAAVAPAHRETVLFIGSKETLFDASKAEMAGKVDVKYASNIMEVFQILEKTHVSIMVCSFDVQSEADRTFVQMMKKEHPYIFVIAVCDSTDSTRLIELINQAKIFRFVKKPVHIPILARYIMSGIAQAEEVRKNPALIRKQQTDEMHQSIANSASAQLIRDQLARVNKSMSERFSKFLGFFRRS